MKPLPLKINPLQVPLTNISNFSNNYILVHIIYYWKSHEINCEEFQKMFKNTDKRLLLKPA